MSRLFSIFILTLLPALGNGVLRWGFGAGDLGSAGAFGLTSGSAINGVQENPAILSSLEREIATSFRFLTGDAEFHREGIDAGLRDGSGIYPDFAISWKGSHPDWTWGAGISVISGLEAKWLYEDLPGGIGGISYGTLPHESRYTAIKLALAGSYQVSEELALGLSLGMIQSKVRFDAPFVFQSIPALRGAKADLLLEADDWTPTVTLGAVYQINKSWRVGLDITPPRTFDHRGSARVDYSAQLPALGLGSADPLATYTAHTGNELPLEISLGTSWQVTEKLSLGLRADRLQWSSAYDKMSVDLRNGSNPAINDALGSRLQDDIPLRWENRWALALGARYQVSPAWTLQAGWRYAKSPVPDELVTPLNGAILEQAVTLGLTWRRDDWEVDLAWAHEFSPSVKIDRSGYQAGEYSNSTLEVAIDHFSLSMRRSF